MISEEVYEALRKEYEDVRSENMQLREALIGLQSRLVEYISKYNRLVSVPVRGVGCFSKK